MLTSVTGTSRKVTAVAVLALGLTLQSGSAGAAEDTYDFDKGHTEIRFLWNHLGLSTQSGEFRDYDGTVVWDTENIDNSKVNVTIKVASMDTGVPALDKDLLSERFFDVAKYPEITFKSTGIRQIGVDRGQVIGDLTIHGVTKPVNLDVNLLFTGEHPLAPYVEAFAGVHYVSFAARTEILRSEFDVGRSVPLVSDRIEIRIQTELRRQS